MHKTTAQLEASLDAILAAPADAGPIEMIVRRPGVDQREVLQAGVLDTALGLVGDSWRHRGSTSTATQLTLMNVRVVGAMADDRSRWPLAGDQIYVDMDLSETNLPPGTRLRVGEAVIEISDVPHTGCDKFAARFGKEALRFANVGSGRTNRFRGVNASVVEGGAFEVGDKITKLAE